MLLLLLPLAHASEEGIVGYAWDGCGDCHKPLAPDAVTVELGAEATTVKGGETVGITLQVRSTEAAHTQAGLDVGATDGRLSPGATLLFRDYEITHQFPHDLTDGSIVFEMEWTAPAYATTVTLSGVGNAVDGLSTATDDGWERDELTLTVVSDCLDEDGDRVGDCEGDCDDTDPTAYPEAEEVLDGVDNDCDGDVDEGTTAFDDDGDGLSEDDGDCDDADPAVTACGDTADAEDTGIAPFAPDRCGCSTGSAWLLLGLIGWRRRSAALGDRHPGERGL